MKTDHLVFMIPLGIATVGSSVNVRDAIWFKLEKSNGATMPDITMCKGKDCWQKYSCYRFNAKPDSMQSYFLNAPVDKDGNCKYYSKDDGRRYDQVDDDTDCD